MFEFKEKNSMNKGNRETEVDIFTECDTKLDVQQKSRMQPE